MSGKKKNVKKNGVAVCPHDEGRCDRAMVCILGKWEACELLTRNVVESCGACKRKRGKCGWRCFKGLRGWERGDRLVAMMERERMRI